MAQISLSTVTRTAERTSTALLGGCGRGRGMGVVEVGMSGICVSGLVIYYSIAG